MRKMNIKPLSPSRGILKGEILSLIFDALRAENCGMRRNSRVRHSVYIKMSREYYDGLVSVDGLFFGIENSLIRQFFGVRFRDS